MDIDDNATRPQRKSKRPVSSPRYQWLIVLVVLVVVVFIVLVAIHSPVGIEIVVLVVPLLIEIVRAVASPR